MIILDGLEDIEGRFATIPHQPALLTLG